MWHFDVRSRRSLNMMKRICQVGEEGLKSTAWVQQAKASHEMSGATSCGVRLYSDELTLELEGVFAVCKEKYLVYRGGIRHTVLSQRPLREALIISASCSTFSMNVFLDPTSPSPTLSMHTCSYIFGISSLHPLPPYVLAPNTHSRPPFSR